MPCKQHMDVIAEDLSSSHKIATDLGSLLPKKADKYYDGAATIPMKLSVSTRMKLREQLTPDANGIILAMVGLPARGKSFISRKTERFLQWRGLETRTFNVGKYRRVAVAPEESGRSDFFDVHNTSAMTARENAAAAALADALAFLDGGGKVAILDATNSTIARRRRIAEQLKTHRHKYSIIFVEAVCDDAEVLDINMRSKVENSPDFENMTLAEALTDLKARIAKYENAYETVQDEEGAYIKLFNLSSKVMANHCYGRVSKSILPYLMAVHVGSRPIWLARAGSGISNPQRLGDGTRNCNLSPTGQNFAASLSSFVQERQRRFWENAKSAEEPMQVFTSTWARAIDSICSETRKHEQTSALNPIDKGAIGSDWWDSECNHDRPPWSDAERDHPEFFRLWKADPLHCRFPGGECYMDVVARLEGLLIQVEMCTTPVLIVSHLTVMQLLIAYFQGVPIEKAWDISVPKNVVFEVTPTSGGGFVCEQHSLPITARSRSQHEATKRPLSSDYQLGKAPHLDAENMLERAFMTAKRQKSIP